MGARLDCVAAAAMLAAAGCAAPAWAALQVEKGSAFAAPAAAQADAASPLTLGTLVVLALAAVCAVAAFARVRWFRWQEGIGPAWRMSPSLGVLAFASILLAGWWGAMAGAAGAASLTEAPEGGAAPGSSALVRNVVIGAAAAGAQLAWMALVAWFIAWQAKGGEAGAGVGAGARSDAGAGAVAGAGAGAGADAGAVAIPEQPAPWRAAVAVTVLVNVLGWPILLVVSWLASVIELQFSGETPRLGHATLQEMSEAGPSNAWWWGAAAMAAVVAPITEELLYRGFLQQGLRRAPMSRGLSIGMASCVFALFHWGALAEGARFSGMCTLAALSVLLGYVYERTGRMSMCIATHALFNAVNLARL